MLLEEVKINYEILAKACSFYDMNFEQIEVPWIVSEEASLTTAPPNGIFKIDDQQHLVGSAEQGFIQLLMQNSPKLIPDKYYYSVSPCFRRDTPSEKYSRWFIKLELFCLLEKREENNVLFDFIYNARYVHGPLIAPMKNIYEVYFENGTIDLECEGLELGSYGVRTLSDGKKFVYGTGVALPRAQLIREY